MADGDLISRASLLAGIEELKKSPWYNFGKADGTNHEGMKVLWHYGYQQRKEAVQVIEEVCIMEEPAVLADSGWISTKDSMPEKSVPVLICANGHRVTAYYDKVKEVFRLTEDNNMFYLTDFVTHWMPLPEPPKEGK